MLQLYDLLEGLPLVWEGQRSACDHATSPSGSTVIGLGLVADAGTRVDP